MPMQSRNRGGDKYDTLFVLGKQGPDSNPAQLYRVTQIDIENSISVVLSIGPKARSFLSLGSKPSRSNR